MKNYTFIILTSLFFVSLLSFTISEEEREFTGEAGVVNDTVPTKFIVSEALYTEGWDTLAQPNFWRALMKMEKDSGIINIGSTREIIERVAIDEWDLFSDEEKSDYRDSVRVHHQLPEDEHIYLTSGKKHFYDFDKVMPSIGRGIEVFEENNVDGFYAQAILLIESPNKLQKSQVGAYGSFQLMRKVAIKMGLRVSGGIDERKDFDKSAWAAAKLIKTVCIPETNKILFEYGLNYNPEDIWYRLLVLHVYHAGAGNVKRAIRNIEFPCDDRSLITTLWQTEAGGFRNASQNYSQLALASLMELDELLEKNLQ